MGLDLVQNANVKSEKTAPQEVQAVVSKEHITIPMQNASVKLEEAAPQEAQVAVSKENIAMPVSASSEPEKMVVLLPDNGIEQTRSTSRNEEDVQVNITGIGGINSGKAVVDASQDRTDTEHSSSSSFGDTGSCVETESSSGLSDSEVESPMDDDWSEPLLIRKKKVTTHWRSFIRPLMWRCKWLELQMRKLHSQELKYDKELAAYNYRKQLEFSKYVVDGFDVKSIPISDSTRKNKVMKRKKRRRAEEGDLSSYMSNHNVFSYYENRDNTDGACVQNFRGVAMRGNADKIEEPVLNDTWYSDREDNDKSLDDIFQKIETLELQVQKLKTRIDSVVSENPGKFCSVTQLSTIGSDRFNGSDRNGITFPVSLARASSQLKSEFYEEDVLVPGNTSSTREGITPFIETTNRLQAEILQENTKNEVLVQNKKVKEELHDLEDARNQLGDLIKEPGKDQKSISLAQFSKPELVTENTTVRDLHSALKACSTSRLNGARNARRGKQKLGSKSGNRR